MTTSSPNVIPYARQWLDEDDVAAICEVLRSAWMTTGPKVAEFERALADWVGAKEAVALSSGTAAVHAALYALGIGPGDEVIAPAMTFVATTNAIVFQGGIPVFADVTPGSLLLDPGKIEALITPRTRALIAVDYTGHPCDYDALRDIAQRHGLALVADACHALGGQYKGRHVGTLADVNIFSFHPAKHLCTGEGGMVTTQNPEYAERMRRFRNHGIATDFRQRAEQGTWYYEMVDLGYNYRLTDLQCALGISQLRKLPQWLRRRREIARRYDDSFRGLPEISPLTVSPEVSHAYHLYVILLNLDRGQLDRGRVYKALRDEGIGVNVHYIPVHLHPFYRQRFGTGPGLCPVAEAAYERMLTVPLFPAMTEEEIDRVQAAITHVVQLHHRSEAAAS
ncbi:UDP-4-amino-4,6-dideoxy-N-acetyl-beta-L-altrosamine transaminase [Desulfobacca acetoxidans]